MAEIFDWPTELRPQGVEWRLTRSQVFGVSAFDGSAQASPLGAPRWAFTIDTGRLHLHEVPLWEALIDRLDGGVNRVRCWDWRREAPLGVATGVPLVRVSAAGKTLATKGWTPSTAGILLRGSYVGVNGELNRTVLDATSDGAGWATLTLARPLRAAPAVDVALVLVKPVAKFYCTTTDTAFRQDGARPSGQSYTFEEDLAP